MHSMDVRLFAVKPLRTWFNMDACGGLVPVRAADVTMILDRPMGYTCPVGFFRVKSVMRVEPRGITPLLGRVEGWSD